MVELRSLLFGVKLLDLMGGASKSLATRLSPLKPTPWPNANTRLLGPAAGQPIDPAKRVETFDPAQYERYVLEWVDGFLQGKYAELQQRGGAGDKGRDIVAWLDPSEVTPRRLDIYQCKHYANAVGLGDLLPEMGKLLYYTLMGDYPIPETYWIVAQKGVTGSLQDIIDDRERLRKAVVDGWSKHIKLKITKKVSIELDAAMQAHIKKFPFERVKVKQPHELLKEHAQTGYHLRVFGKPLIERPKPPAPPSLVAPIELGYIRQLYAIIAEATATDVSCPADFAHLTHYAFLFAQARLAFYCAEGLKELARDGMENEEYFKALLDEFYNGLLMTYLMGRGIPGMKRMMTTVERAALLPLGGHELAPLVEASDRHGICHHLANDGRFIWIEPNA